MRLDKSPPAPNNAIPVQSALLTPPAASNRDGRMKNALFISKNLIGDALNIAPAWQAWWALHQNSGYEMDLVTNPDHVAPLYSVMGVPTRVIAATSPEKKYDFTFTFDVSRAFQYGHRYRIHICEAYAKMLGVSISSVKPVCLLDEALYRGEDIEDSCILISPFSESCSSRSGQPPNKMLPFTKWQPIIRYLQSFGRAIYVLGSGRDTEAPEFTLPKDRFLLGSHSLLEVARIMRDRAALLVTIDNGMSHLAASQELPTFLFYPACLSKAWIVPRGNPHCVPMQLDPASCDPASIMQVAVDVVPHLLAAKVKQGT
jgi:ADP-heptose:LPS heptosyltransferase